MKIIINYVVLILLSFFAIESKAQDPIFTQFTLMPETLNPGFTGFQYNWRAGLLSRRQWIDGNKAIDTDFGFINKMVSDHAAIGMTILNNREVFTKYNFFQINMAYSYKVEIDYRWVFRPGIEVGYGRKSFNFKNLLLEDQININTATINDTSVDLGVQNQNENINFFDISAGFVIDNEDGWFGLSIKHLTRPNISFLNENNIPLDLFFSLHSGYAFDIDGLPSSLFPDKTKLLINANYMRQSQFNRLDLGTALKFEALTIGVNLVTNPEGKSINSHLITSINPYVSVHFGDFNFGYSYDFNTSKIGRMQGIHEMSLTWQLRFCGTCLAKVNKYYDYSK